MKYVIYEYEEGIKQLFEKYPNLKQYFDNLTLDNDFMNKFINCVYNSVDYMNELIYKELHNRKEYHRVGKMHIFENELTHEISRLYVENYKIIIESKDKTNIFFTYNYEMRYTVYGNFLYGKEGKIYAGKNKFSCHRRRSFRTHCGHYSFKNM